MPSRQLHFGLNTLSAGMHPAAWLTPEADPIGYIKPEQWLRLAQIAEKGALDAIFLADEPGLNLSEDGTLPGPSFAALDPLILLSSLAAVTTHVGLAATITTTYEEPYNVARRVASLDHVSRGRAAWNVVTTVDASVAGNFGARPHAPREERYERAGEFIEVVRALWDSWDEDAQIADKATQRFTRPGAIRAINHRGKHFHVDGPPNVPRSPQGRPVVVQAGGSSPGIDLAARYAEAVFVSAASLEDALAYTKELRRRTAAYGRPADAVRVLPGFSFVLGGTEEEARRRNAELNEFAGERRRQWLAWQISVDPAELDWDKPLPDWLLTSKEPASGSQGARDIVLNLARRESLTLRQILDRVLTWHRLVIGSPEQIADAIEEWFVVGAVDGFNLMPDVNPFGIEAFVEHVVPILRRRGLFRSQYEGVTLRDHLGLPHPERLAAVA
ncbi:MAG: LLM class flavin-dependent oxidoreductase [Methylocystaceae bacterium]|nr:MAG: LLM class flavin-dependent oxidoreductase [Methylocystaceae bacterium]